MRIGIGQHSAMKGGGVGEGSVTIDRRRAPVSQSHEPRQSVE